MSVNSEAIYETRPWKIFGAGPNKVAAGAFHGDTVGSLGPKDVRFTRTKDNRVVYAITLGLPTQELTIEALGSSSGTSPGKIAKVEVFGARQTPVWNQSENGLTIKVPESISGIPEYGVVVKAYLA
jgi:alpha-L-fucosidase